MKKYKILEDQYSARVKAITDLKLGLEPRHDDEISDLRNRLTRINSALDEARKELHSLAVDCGRIDG